MEACPGKGFIGQLVVFHVGGVTLVRSCMLHSLSPTAISIEHIDSSTSEGPRPDNVYVSGE